MPLLSQRVQQLKPSATATFLQKVVDLKAQGVAVLSFNVGEPDFRPPEHVLAACHRALDAGFTRYTSVAGVTALRQAICRDSAQRRKLQHEPNEVLVTTGAKHALYNICLTVLGPGDEAIVPTPCWVSYPEQCELAQARPVLVPTSAEHGFKMTPAQLAAAVTPRTRALFLCSPCNPTGAAYSRNELLALAEVARSHDFWIVVDEIYGELVYGGFVQHSLLEVAPDLRDRMIVVDGVSKRYAMTGFRIGWLLGPRPIVEACEALQSQQTSNATTVAQYAALAALEGPNDAVERMRAAFERRRALTLEALSKIQGIHCRAPEGAFYVFFDVREHFGRTLGGHRIDHDEALAEFLLDETRVAVVPGSAFLAPGYLRLSYAASEEELTEGLSRIARALG